MTDSPLDVLAAPRSNLDRINAQILDLLVERMRTCLEIAR
ncbi:MAG: chorismate mutase, partial [Bifidobacteriaceae bacterium]|nr:chorismate mutase [Bifidobacteriaceae bacterium]